MARVPSIAAALLVLPSLAGCGEGFRDETSDPVVTVERPAPKQQPEQRLEKAECPPEAGPGCAEAEGRIVFVERVDPDGDGDAHFVIVDGNSITLPGMTAIDVRRGLRPDPLPGVGDLVSAAGPVQTGSHGQSQIHALVLNVAGPASDG